MSTHEFIAASQRQQQDLSQALATPEGYLDDWSFASRLDVHSALPGNTSQQVPAGLRPSRTYQPSAWPTAPRHFSPSHLLGSGQPIQMPQMPAQCWNSACPEVRGVDGLFDALALLRDGDVADVIEQRPRILEQRITHPKSQAPPLKEARYSKARCRVPHSLVERRYRNHLNDQIEALRLVVPLVRDDANVPNVEDSSVPLRPVSKAEVVSAATTYIESLESDKARLLGLVDKLREQVNGLQKLVKCDDFPGLPYVNLRQVNATPD